jgi:hypothetical protein
MTGGGCVVVPAELAGRDGKAGPATPDTSPREMLLGNASIAFR